MLAGREHTPTRFKSGPPAQAAVIHQSVSLNCADFGATASCVDIMQQALSANCISMLNIMSLGLACTSLLVRLLVAPLILGICVTYSAGHAICPAKKICILQPHSATPVT